MNTLPPLSLYVHLPWCVRKCPYCDFNSHRGGDANQRRAYLRALLQDIAREAARPELRQQLRQEPQQKLRQELQQKAPQELQREPPPHSRPVSSIFFGGGTPSLFSAEQLQQALQAVDSAFTLQADAEITLEANPGTVECGNLREYRRIGINRLSLGAQSFAAPQLAALGRIHSVADIARAFDAAVKGGFDNINLDVMYALPGQDVRAALADLDAAIALGPTHISWYQLTLEPNTVFHARPPAGLPDADAAAAMETAGAARLAAAAYERYEVSAYARSQRHCRHNLNYWLFGDYIGVGAGAHGKLTTADGIVRRVKPANPQQYMLSMQSGAAIEGGASAALSADDVQFEFMLNALRLVQGFTEQLYAERTGLAVEALRRQLHVLRDRGLMQQAAAGRWHPSALGQRFLNDLQAHFLPDANCRRAPGQGFARQAAAVGGGRKSPSAPPPADIYAQ